MNVPQLKSARIVVAFTGAQGVGKTTLAFALREELTRLRIGPCTVHEKLGQTAAARGVPLGQHANALTIMEFAKLHVRREHCLGPGFHLLDRCFADLLAYTLTVCGDQPFLIDLIQELAFASLSSVDLVVRVPLIPALATSHSPNESAHFRARIDEVIGQILRSPGITTLELTAPQTHDRVQQIMATLRDKSVL